MPEENFGRFHDRFRERRVGVDAFGEIANGRAHLDCDHAFGNEFARAVADDPTPSTRSVSASTMSLVSPSVRSKLIARPEAPHGNLATSMFRPFARASASVTPHHATSGSVKTTAGMTTSLNSLASPTNASTAMRASFDALCASITPPTMSPIAGSTGPSFPGAR
jgi:hypothetical protein